MHQSVTLNLQNRYLVPPSSIAAHHIYRSGVERLLNGQGAADGRQISIKRRHEGKVGGWIAMGGNGEAPTARRAMLGADHRADLRMVSHLTDLIHCLTLCSGLSSIPYLEGQAMRLTTDSIWAVIYSIAVAVFILAYVHIPA